MTTTTQAGIVLALLAALVLLLGLSRQQRRRRAAEMPTTEPVTEPVAEPVAALDEGTPETDQPPLQAADVEEAPVLPEPAEDEPVREPAAEQPTLDAVDAVDVEDADGEVADLEEAPAADDLVEEPPAPQRRRGLFRRRREVPEPDFGSLPTLVPALDADGELAGDLAGDAALSPEDAEAAPGERSADETPEQAELRTLREQLRALEQVVQEQASEPPTAALARVEQAAAEQSAAYLRQVSMVVQGLAAHVPQEEHPQRTLARVAAAVERLGVPNSMRRPALPVTSQPPVRRGPSHRRDLPELEAAATAPEPDSVVDVFSNLDVAGDEFRHTELPAAPEAPPVEQAAVEQHAVELAVPETAPLETLAMVPAGVESYASSAGSVEEAGPTELSGELVIPSFEEPELVLPVPPPAVIALDSRRRGRRRSST